MIEMILIEAASGARALSPPSLLTGGTNIGTHTAEGGLAAAFDGVTSQTVVSSANCPAPSVSGYGNTCGKDYAGTFYVLTKVEIWGPSDSGFRGDGASAGLRYLGWDGSAWQVLWAGTYPAGNGATVSTTSGIAMIPCSKFKTDMEGNGTNTTRIAELKFTGYPA